MKLTRKLLWIAGALWAAALIAGIGFWLRPVSYLNGTMYAREAFSGVENRQVTVEGHRMHYLAEGPRSGPVVVLVHGLGGRAEDWSNLSPFFARAGFRVYMPDLFGYGRSERPRDFSYSVRDQANAVVDFMNALGLKQVNLGGWSMGGWIVQIIAASHPETVKRLMLFDSAGIYAKPDWNTNLFMPRTPGDLDQLEALLMPHPPRIPGFVARDVLRLSAQRRWVTQRALNTMMTGKDTTDGLLPELTIPVLILWGKEDHITPLDLGKKMQQLIPRSELLVYDGCGHLAPGQCASAMGPTVAEFAQK
jgi:pimeloyl-ACP methyl ester carboxylesterase